MPTIRISRSHKKNVKDARAAVERVAEHIAERFSVDYGWEGNTLHFERTGVDGHIMLGKGNVSVVANLSFLLTPLMGPIEEAIHEHIDREFC